MKSLIIIALLLTASTAFAACQVWPLYQQYRSPGSMNVTCVYKAGFQTVTIEGNGRYCASYLMYNPATKKTCW